MFAHRLPEYLFTGTDADAAAKLFSRAIDLESLGFHAEGRALRYNAQRILDGGNVRTPAFPAPVRKPPAPADTTAEDYTSSVRPRFLDRERALQSWSWLRFAWFVVLSSMTLYVLFNVAASLVGPR